MHLDHLIGVSERLRCNFPTTFISSRDETKDHLKFSLGAALHRQSTGTPPVERIIVGTGGEVAAAGKRRSWIDGVIAREKGTGEDHGGKVAANGEDAMDADGETTSFGEDRGGIAAREECSASVLEEAREDDLGMRSVLGKMI
jgi:hypothetical protein